eukprot:gene13692-biopygen3563
MELRGSISGQLIPPLTIHYRCPFHVPARHVKRNGGGNWPGGPKGTVNGNWAAQKERLGENWSGRQEGPAGTGNDALFGRGALAPLSAALAAYPRRIRVRARHLPADRLPLRLPVRPAVRPAVRLAGRLPELRRRRGPLSLLQSVRPRRPPKLREPCGQGAAAGGISNIRGMIGDEEPAPREHRI